jgi:hypothetical protein
MPDSCSDCGRPSTGTFSLWYPAVNDGKPTGKFHQSDELRPLCDSCTQNRREAGQIR